MLNRNIKLITTLLRMTVWIMWILLICLDGLGASSTIKEAVYWIPFIAMGFFISWCLDGFIRDSQLGRVLIFIIPFFVLCDFVQG